MCTSFSKASSDLCNNIMTMARRICTEYAYPEGLSSFTACRLIALDKNPGVCSFGVGEVVRRIIGKAVLGPLKEDVQHATGYIQLCAGQECGSEVAIHAMREIFSNDDKKEFYWQMPLMRLIALTGGLPSFTSTSSALL